MQAGVIVGGCRIEHAPGSAVSKQALEGLLAPVVKRLEYAIRMVGFRRKRIVKKDLEIPLEFTHQVAVRPAFHGKTERGWHFCGLRGFVVTPPNNLKRRWGATRLVTDNKRGFVDWRVAGHRTFVSEEGAGSVALFLG